MAGPYIVTTKRPCDACDGDACELLWDHGRVIDSVRCDAGCDEEGNVIAARVAATTLEEAKREGHRIVNEEYPEVGGMARAEVSLAIERLPAEGGEVTLPDGTEIVVEPTTALDLFAATDRGPEHREGVTVDQQAVAAFNAAHAFRSQEVSG